MRATFSQWIFGSQVFPAEADLLEFQHRFLICTLLVCAACTAAYAVFSLFMVLPQPLWMRLNWLALTAAVLGLWWWLRARPAHYRHITWCLMALTLLSLTVSSVLNPYNPLTFLWLFSTILPAFVLLGRGAGWTLTALAIACASLANVYVHQRFSAVAMQTSVLATLCLALQCHFYVARFRYFFTRMRDYNEHLLQLAQYDTLTGVRNAATYYAQCDQLIRIAQRADRSFAVLFVDLDHFKAINDTHGHAAGDAVLQAVALQLTETVRDTDVLGRVGGEEFSILLPDTDSQGAMELAERLRAAVEALQVQIGPQVFLSVTASLGVTVCREAVHDILHIQHEADQAMYHAKAAGRNRVSLFAAGMR